MHDRTVLCLIDVCPEKELTNAFFPTGLICPVDQRLHDFRCDPVLGPIDVHAINGCRHPFEAVLIAMEQVAQVDLAHCLRQINESLVRFRSTQMEGLQHESGVAADAIQVLKCLLKTLDEIPLSLTQPDAMFVLLFVRHVRSFCVSDLRLR